MSGGEVPGRQGETTPPKPLRPLLVTHSGTFHLDDAFAYAVLRSAWASRATTTRWSAPATGR